MLTRIKQDDFLKDNLSWLCIEPMLISIRGKDLDEKSAMYNQLNEGQRALYLFYAFYNHVHSIEEFYWFATYFMGELKAWNGLKKEDFFRDRGLNKFYMKLISITLIGFVPFEVFSFGGGHPVPK